MKSSLRSAASWAIIGFALAMVEGAPSRAEDAPASPPPTPSMDSRPATQEQIKTLARVMKNMLSRMNKVEKSSGEGELDLSQIPKQGPAVESPVSGATHAKMGSGIAPNWKVYFDLNLVNRPAAASPLTFANYHALLFYEILPSSDLQFSFDVNPSPRFYELDYQLTKRIQLRAGKIWIPFDDMSPHNIFGGRVNTSTLGVSSARFLPDIWSELGVGAKFSMIDESMLTLTGHLYAVNGLGSGGTDPVTTGGTYPQFSDSSSLSTDNNRDKAFGGRIHTLIAKRLGIGASAYTARWNDDTSASARRLSIVGADAQFKLTNVTEFRAGLATMTIGIDADSKGRSQFKRGGAYGEVGQKFGSENQWKALLRGGQVQLDDRVIDVTDQKIFGGTLLYKPSTIEFSAHHSRDVKRVVGKSAYSYSALRVIIAL